MKIYRNPKIETKDRRESPNDFMRAFLRYVKRTGRKTLTPKAFAIIRGEKK